jgi:hypothetical protein
MKCDDFLSWRATGSWWQQWRARRHARRCSQCAATAKFLLDVERELRRPESLPAHQRALWDEASLRESSTRSYLVRNRRFILIGVGAGAAAAVVLVVLWMRSNSGSGQMVKDVRKKPDPTRIVLRALDASKELAKLLLDVDSLQAELPKLSKQAELVEARQQVDATIETYSRW